MSDSSQERDRDPATVRIPEPIADDSVAFGLAGTSRSEDAKAIQSLFADPFSKKDPPRHVDDSEQLGWPFQSLADCVRPAPDPAAGPEVLVVTPSFNQARFLETTIRSVLLQGYPNLRYVVVDGGSTDGSLEILEHYRDAIDHVIVEPDRGQSDAILKGIGTSNQGWFNWINSDDFLTPGIIQRLVAESLENFDLWTANVQVVGDGPPYPMLNQNLDAAAILREDRYSFSQPGLWFRLHHFLECGGIRREFQYGFDWDLLIRYLADHARVQYSNHIGAVFRVHEASKTNVEQQKAEQENRFEREHALIRARLESELSPELSSASRLGRRRRPWNAWLIEQLDDWKTSPARLSIRIMMQSFGDPRARWSARTMATVARLLSRYVRPGWKNRKRTIP